MPTRIARFTAAACCLLVLAALAVWFRPAGGEAAEGPVAHWVFDPDRLAAQGKAVPNLVGDVPVTLAGTPRFVTGTPTPALEFRSESDRAFVDGRALARAGLLPKAALSVVTWVRVDRGEPVGGLGGLVSLFQNHFEAERGFLLGYETDRFVFGLAAGPAGDRAGTMSFVRGRTKFVPGRWYHLAATYDGGRMRLWVNGRLDGESAEQSGPIRYPGGNVPLTIGRYRNGTDPADGYNNNEDDVPLLGAVREVSLYSHAVSEKEVADLFAASRALVDAPAVAAPPAFVVPPYLLFPTTDSISVMWETSLPGPSVVEYGRGGKLDQRVELKDSVTMHEVRLKGLEPEARYAYRVSTALPDGGTLASDVRTFQTAVREDSAFSFAVIGDTQRNPRVTGRVTRQMWARRPNFTIHCGDVVDNGPDKAEWVDELFRPAAPLLGRVAVFPCIGNHERNHAHYYRYFAALPAPQYYYTYRYGNAQFFVIDSNKSLDPKSEQYIWLERELSRSNATWKFAYHHHPAFTSDDNDYGSTWRGETSRFGDKNAQNLIPLYERYGVDINFNGHIHVYERSWPLRGGRVERQKGVVYVTSGGGGATLENFAPTPSWFKAQCRVDYHYCLLSVNGGRLEFKAFDHKGQLFDSFELTK
jgi:hypothetical protein